MRFIYAVTMAAFATSIAYAQAQPADLPIAVAPFEQDVHRSYTTAEGLPDNDATRIAIDADGRVVATTAGGIAVFDGVRWETADETPEPQELSASERAELERTAGGDVDIRSVARHQQNTAVAAAAGLFMHDGHSWRMVLSRDGEVRWAPVDVRAVAYDSGGRLWFAAPQGVGYRVAEDEWKLFTGADGLPFNDFTCMAAGPGSVWFGTTNGAIRYRDGEFSFRQGRRWLLDNHVQDIAVDAHGNAWIATVHGISCIESIPMSLAGKAAFFEAEIEKYHRRTRLDYVNAAVLDSPGDKSSAKPEFSDNDGHAMGIYLAAMSLGYAATGDPAMKQQAQRAFRALAFLSEVTQGGTHPAPKGFIARAVKPTSEEDPNPQFDLAYDQRRNERDALWKIIQPRWPIDETGEWYWKNDSSPDELDGHFLGYGTYFDRACETEEEKDAVRVVVSRIVDHILDHDYNMIDYDGKPTRWGHFSPDDLNRNPAWVIERGLNSLSILAYLSVAHRVTGDPRYRDEYLHLAFDEGYAMNGMTQPKDLAGPGTFGQGDDVMAFMNYYHLIRYETDPKLLSMYYFTIRRHFDMERYERNPFTTFVYAACCQGKVRADQWGAADLSLPHSTFTNAIDTLMRYPLDLIDWPMSNAHRIDMVPLQPHLGQGPDTGHRVDGYTFPVDENQQIRWDRDPYFLTATTPGTTLREGTHYLLAYYMGLAHGFVRDVIPPD